MNETVRIIFFVVASISIAVLFWCHRVFCRRNDKRLSYTPRLPIKKKRWNGKRNRPTSASPLRDISSNRDRSASYIPLLSQDSSNPPLLGFKNAANMAQVDISKVIGFRNTADGCPSTSEAPYPSKLNNNNSTPYPLCTILPQPSTSKASYSSGNLRNETPESMKNICYHNRLPNRNRNSRSSRILYPAEFNTYKEQSCSNPALFLISNGATMECSSLLPYPPEQTSCEMRDFTKSNPYTHIYEVPYQESNWTTSPPSATEDSLESQTQDRSTISYPPVETTPPVIHTGITLRPPSYEEALRNNFEL